MPHIIIKMYPGRTTEQKEELSKKILNDVVCITGCKKEAVSIAFEEVSPEDWKEKVYDPDIIGNENNLWIKPGYKM